MRQALLSLILGLIVSPASARVLRCANVPSASAKITFEGSNFQESASLFLSVTRAGALDFGEELEMDFLNTSRTGYSRYNGKTSNSDFPMASLWLNITYVSDRGYFPGELTIKSSSSSRPIPLICTLTQR